LVARKQLLIFLVCVHALGAEQRALDSEHADAIPIFEDAMGVLDGYAKKTKGKSERLGKVIRTVLAAIPERRIGISIDPTMPNDVYNGIVFRIFEAKRAPHISFHPDVMRLYKKYPSIVLSAFVHEMQHAFDYLSNEEYYVRVAGNQLEHYLYELDAYHSEAEFILDFVARQKTYQMTAFEKFLAASFEKNGLNDFSEALQGHSREITYHLLAIRDSNQAYEDKLSAIDKLLMGGLEKDFAKIPNEAKKFSYLVAVRSAVTFTPQILHDLSYKKNGKEPNPQEVPQLFSKQFEILRKLGAILSDNAEFFNNYTAENRRKITLSP